MPDCFIIMPMSTRPDLIDSYGGDNQHFEHVLQQLFKPAVEQAGLNPIEPAAQGSDIIHAKIIANLESADLVLCDMSALNPNVFFELGIRTALNKPTCMVRDDTTTTIPFDTGIINYHTYLSSLTSWDIKKEITKLADHIEKSAGSSSDGNSLWKQFGISTRAHMDRGPGTKDDKFDYVVKQLDTLNDRLRSVSLESKRERRAFTEKQQRVRLSDRITVNSKLLFTKIDEIGKTPGSFAAEAGIPNSTLERIMFSNPPISKHTLYKIARALDVPASILILDD